MCDNNDDDFDEDDGKWLQDGLYASDVVTMSLFHFWSENVHFS